VEQKPYTRPIFIVLGVAAAVAILILILLNKTREAPTKLQPSPLPSTSRSTSSAKGAGPRPAATGSPGAATRWWSSPAGRAGSTLDVEHPEIGAAGLHPDQNSYCAMLRSSMGSDKNPLTATATADENLLVSTRAWLAELEALSSGPVHQAWVTFGDALVKALQSPQAGSSPDAAVSAAMTIIAADARSSCNLDLSRTG